MWHSSVFFKAVWFGGVLGLGADDPDGSDGALALILENSWVFVAME